MCTETADSSIKYRQWSHGVLKCKQSNDRFRLIHVQLNDKGQCQSRDSALSTVGWEVARGRNTRVCGAASPPLPPKGEGTSFCGINAMKGVFL